MPKQQVPDIDFDFFVLPQLKELYEQNKIYINEEYQRGDIWKHNQQVELIKSIENRYSIGVIVLFINDLGQYEILDGQQRILTIMKYVNDQLDLTNTNTQKYSELNLREKTLIDAYCIYYIKLKSHDAESKEEDIVQTFLRLQEGTPLNKAEKINAHRGQFKDTFREIRQSHPLFALLGPEKRFRWRQLAAELLAIELESDFDKGVFPNLDLPSMIAIIKKYQYSISNKKVKLVKGNLDLLYNSLHLLLTGFTVREVVSFYLLISYLRKKKADNSNLLNEIFVFAQEFLKNLNSFSIYDEAPPENMGMEIFMKYKNYKQEAKILTTGESINKRFTIILEEFQRLNPFITKDSKRLHDAEQKRIMYFKQQGKCPECGKLMDFRVSSGHHEIPHREGGKTDDLSHAVLMHAKCHEKYEKRIAKEKST